MRGKLIRKQGPKSGTAWGPLHGSSGAWQEGRRRRVSCRGVSSDDSEKPRSHPWWHLDCAGIEAEPSRLAGRTGIPAARLGEDLRRKQAAQGGCLDKGREEGGGSVKGDFFFRQRKQHRDTLFNKLCFSNHRSKVKRN